MQLRTDKKEMWRRREGQMYLVLATQMMEMNDYAGAASTLETVLKQFGEDVDILSGLGRLYLQVTNSFLHILQSHNTDSGKN